jgi:flagellar hook-basal body complex protein FliE
MVSRLLTATAVLVAFGGVLLIAQSDKPTTAKTMATAAEKLLGTLTADQKTKATFAFDDPHRKSWFFTPQQDKQKKSTRKGLRMDGLNADQKTAMMDLLKAGLSATGYEQATGIMSLESLLAELEGKGGGMTRDPSWYFVSLFGTPGNGAWGWRIEGHHLSVNFTLDKGEVVSASPLLFGTNPAEIKAGPNKGKRMLPEIEDAAKELIKSLTEEQNTLAKQAKQLPEIKEGQPTAGVGDPVGIAAAKLTAAQVKMLNKLITAYADRLPGDIASKEKKEATGAAAEKVFFAYCIEADKPGKPYTYRVQGPTFVIEFLNVQGDSARNPANHIHSGWRTLPADFAVAGK